MSADMQRLFQDVFNASPIGIAVANLDEKLLFVNPALCSMLGFSEGELRGKHGVDFSPPQDREKDRTVFEQLRAGSIDHYQLEKRYLRKGGSWIWGRLRISLLRSPPTPLVLAMVEDITERRQAEKALRESEEKFRSVFQDAGVGMVIVSLQGRFLAANKTFCDCLGYSEKEILEKTVESVTVAEDWPALSQKLGEAVAGTSRLHGFEKRCLHKSGRIVYTETSASLIRSSEGSPQYLVGEVLDITSRKQAEVEVSKMTAKLIEAQEQERRRVARELHDDVEQRLAMLSVQLQQLQEDPSEVSTRVEALRDRLNDISSDVQAISHKLHSTKLEYLGAVAGIGGWCREFAERYRMTIDFASDITSFVPPELGLTLLRVTQEALHNALKHSGTGQVEVRLSEDSGKLHLTVSDSGKGFDTEQAWTGKGLGLTSMRERIRLVDGTILIDSKPMGGTRIHVSLPLAPSHSQKIAA